MASTVRALLAAATDRLGSVSETPQLDAQVLLAHALGRDRGWLYAWPEHQPNTGTVQRFDTLVDARAEGQPVAYLTGRREFWSLAFKVNEATLIPRPETELLVETVLQLGLPAGSRVLDLGTGSGAIAIALARERPDWRVSAVDSSAAAIAVARDNAASNGAEIAFYTGDWFAPLPADGHFDLIVANPPYIADGDPHLVSGDVRFEPHAALAAGRDGLDDIRRIINGSQRFLHAGAWLWLEHGHDQGTAVAGLLKACGFVDIATHDDLAGRPRLSGGRRPATAQGAPQLLT